MLLERVAVIEKLGHEQADQFLLRVNPEGSSSGTAPTEIPNRIEDIRWVFTRNNPKTESEPIIVMGVSHQFHSFLSQYTDPIELTAVE